MKLDSQDKILLKVSLEKELDRINKQLTEHTNDYSGKWNDYKEKVKWDIIANRDKVDSLLKKVNEDNGSLSW
ncbi:hypothetical protein CWB89_00030 [Pseudoalteromonas piscicida]|uniref:Uncharacterized protein n=1 Tax=Pseudoalteromonas piscicida TaxID=43662 RepID=A0AAQ2ETH9_PSEO7|nr:MULTISPECIES: hypothetical protein [Pseudoalteromonas]TMN34018.1 hypothetical protein CWB95_21955 [Pseudoalteromonas piscicida]TMN40740.1 hypothetical protein CWB94_09450 [Pseudoalteromonas piscicida]TMN50765.1 hypothetical protein CWB91_13735 [Pseudoalteromonas piscicida]TMN57051.1 hypothetical protein CWB92_00560 [Pseudoalteromonas piscicida]TMN59341.1 hypothetical protein CWB93_01765 [Pseudoalteromonas piscicida]